MDQALRIRVAAMPDLAGIVRTHCLAFPDFFLTQLGPRFLKHYYRAVFEYDRGILLVAGKHSAGFVAGFVAPGAYYRRLRTLRFQIGLSLLPRLIARPRLVPRLLVNFRRTGEVNSGLDPNDPTIAELASIGVAPTGAGRGLGRELVLAFCQEARRLGAESVRLTTDSHNNDRVNRFYERIGFTRLRMFEAQRNRWLNEYEIRDLRRFDEEGVPELLPTPNR